MSEHIVDFLQENTTTERGWTLASFERIMYEQFEELINLHFFWGYPL